jgi:glycosyltransferase involved in cell wall biosynthesis
MHHAYCFFSFKGDHESLLQSIRSIRACHPTAKIAVFDDGRHHLPKPPPSDYYERTWFQRGGNLNGRECIMGELLAFQKAARLFGAQWVAKIDCDTVVVDGPRAFSLPASVHADVYGASWHEHGVWGPFYIVSATFIYRMLEAINGFGGLPDEEDFGMTALARQARGRVTIVPWSEHFLNGFDYRLRQFDFDRFRATCAITCGNRMQIGGPDPRAVQARAMRGLVDFLGESAPFDWERVLEGHEVFNTVEDARTEGSKKNARVAVTVRGVAPKPEARRAVRCATNGCTGASERMSLSVVVIGRNNGAFLGECLASSQAQTAQVDEWVYVDDASEDDSVKIAQGFERLQVRSLRNHVGMSAARTIGAEMTTGALMLFVDSDNVLPPDYLATMIEDLGTDHDFAYPSKTFIGSDKALYHHREVYPNDLWEPPVEDRAKLWSRNYADTCSLVRRDAFLAAGGWRSNPADTMFDWDLFLRMSARGSHVRSRARLNYRIHEGNWSARQRDISRREMNGLVRRHAATITVGCVWSGRMGQRFARIWLKALAESMQVAGKTAELLILDDSRTGFPAREISRHKGVFPSFSIQRIHRGMNATQRRPDRRATAEFLSPACNRILDTATGDVVWFIEDDIVVPVHAADVLLRELLQAEKTPRTAVGGCYRSRHEPDHWIAANLGSKVNHLIELPEVPTPVQFTGTGCLMLLRDLAADVRFGTEWVHQHRRVPAHDWMFAWQLEQRGTPVILVPEVVCRHHSSQQEWV